MNVHTENGVMFPFLHCVCVCEICYDWYIVAPISISSKLKSASQDSSFVWSIFVRFPVFGFT